MEEFRNGDSVNGINFQTFFNRRIVTVTVFKSLVACTVFAVLAFYAIAILQSLLLLSPLFYESLYFKNMDYFNQRRQQKRKLVFKYLGNLGRPVFSWTNSPLYTCERPSSRWWRGIADSCQQENRANQLKKSWLTLNQLKVFSIWFYPRGLHWFN